MTKPFGTTPAGEPAQLYTLQNAGGFRADISDYGGTVVNLFTPDRHGQLDDVVLGEAPVEALPGGSGPGRRWVGLHGLRRRGHRVVRGRRAARQRPRHRGGRVGAP